MSSNKLVKLLHLVGELFESYDDARTCERQMCNQLVFKYCKYKKIYLVLTGSIIQTGGVLFERRAEAKGTANDINVIQNSIERKYPLLRYFEVYKTLIMTNCKRAVAIRIHLAMRVV
jgi:hypothetical protein